MPRGSRTERMVGNRKSDDVKMKSTSGFAVIAASRFASAVAASHSVATSIGVLNMPG